MKTWKKVMVFILLPFAFIWHGAKKSAKYMERKSKPAVSLLVAVTMVLSLMPMTAFAATGPSVLVGGVEMYSADGATYYVNGAAVAVTEELANWNAKYENGTLTINNLSVMGTSEHDGAGIYAEGIDLTVDMQGANSVTGGDNQSGSSYGIYMGGYNLLTLSGSGVLSVIGGSATDDSYGIYAEAILIQSGTINATGGTAGNTEDNVSCGIGSREGVFIENGTINATGGAAYMSVGVEICYKISGGTVVATGGNAVYCSYGITRGTNNTEFAGGVVVMRGGTFTSTERYAEATAYGYYNIDLENTKIAGQVVNGTFTGSPEEYDENATALAIVPDGYAVQNTMLTESTLTVNTDTAVVTSGASNVIPLSLYSAGGTLALNEDLVLINLQGAFAVPAFQLGGAADKSVTVSGSGTLIAIGAANNQWSYGIYGGQASDFSVNGAKVIAIGGTASKNSYGIGTNVNVNISNNGSVIAIGGAASENSCGISGATTISDGTVNAIGSTYGLSASSGKLQAGNFIGGTAAVHSTNGVNSLLANGYGYFSGNTQLTPDSNATTVGAANQVVTVKAIPHTHNYTYSANQNVITESCACGHRETATLNAPSGDVIYDGAEKIATVSYSENWKGGNLTVTHNNNINAGDLSASASISIKGATAEIYWTILAATPLYDIPTDLTAAYGDTLADVTLPTATNGTWTWMSPKTSVGNVGSKTFKAIFTPNDDNNYITVEVDVPVTVNKTDPQYTVPTGITATYGEILADVTLPSGWSWDDSLTTSVGNAGTKIFVAIFTPTDTENYKTVKADITVTVNKADSTCTEPTAKLNLVYNGDAMELINAGSAFGGEMQYVLGVNSTTAPANNWSTTIPTGKNAGTYYVWYRVVGDSNHKDAAPACVPVTIAKAQLTVTANNKTITYGDTPANNGVTYAGFVSNEIEHVLGGTLKYDYSYTQYGNVGNYDITPKGLTSDNYEITFQKGVLTVEQREISIHWGGTEFIPYNGNKQVPKVTAGSLVNNDSCDLTASVVETTDGAGIIPGRWHARITAISNGNYCLPKNGRLVEIDYSISKGSQNAPTVLGVAETVKGKADGKITGLTTEMEYATEFTADDDKYTKVTDANMDFAAGTYYVRYQAKGYYNPSTFVEVTIGEGRKLTVTVPQNQVGYTLTVDKTAFEYMGGPTITLIIAEGYSKSENFAVKLNGKDMHWGDYTEIGTQNCTDDVVITVEGIVDITAPTAQISIKDNKWTSFWNSLTFGLFFNENQDVTITATDLGSGVNTIQYYLAGGELKLDEVRTITNWQDYNGTFKIDPNNRYVVYAKVTDNAGNTLYINSDGITLDSIAPTLEGIEDGQTYYGDLTVIKSDEQFYDIKTVTLDGVPMGFTEGTYGLIPADNAEHTVVVEDHAGNKTIYTVTVYKNYTVTFKADGSAINTQTVGHGKDATAPAIPEKEGYTQTAPTWDKDGKNITSDTEINAVYTINKYTITFMDGNDVYKTLTYKHGETVTMPEVPTKNGYIVKWETTIDKASGDATVKAVYTESLKDDTSDSPQTGDNPNLWLWLALLLVSVVGIFGITLYDRKRKVLQQKNFNGLRQ